MKLFSIMFPFLVMFGIMWFLMIRPQQKQQKKHQETVNSVEVDDKVETIGGLCGVVTKVEENYVVISSENSSFKLKKNSLLVVIKPENKLEA